VVPGSLSVSVALNYTDRTVTTVQVSHGVSEASRRPKCSLKLLRVTQLALWFWKHVCEVYLTAQRIVP